MNRRVLAAALLVAAGAVALLVGAYMTWHPLPWLLGGAGALAYGLFVLDVRGRP